MNGEAFAHVPRVLMGLNNFVDDHDVPRARHRRDHGGEEGADHDASYHGPAHLRPRRSSATATAWRCDRSSVVAASPPLGTSTVVSGGHEANCPGQRLTVCVWIPSIGPRSQVD